MDGAMSAYKHVQAGWRVLNDVHCPGYDTHRFDSSHTAPSIDACMKQCYGFRFKFYQSFNSNS